MHQSPRAALKHVAFTVSVCVAMGTLAAWAATTQDSKPSSTPTMNSIDAQGPSMKLGAFSVSLAVKDLSASRQFYEKLGFRQIGGDAKTWIILQNDTTTIGLFQGMFDKNILTFNPGWDHTCKALPEFEDVRDIQKRLKDAGIIPIMAADESTAGPASLVISDPDGNQILLDQHVPKAGK